MTVRLLATAVLAALYVTSVSSWTITDALVGAAAALAILPVAWGHRPRLPAAGPVLRLLRAAFTEYWLGTVHVARALARSRNEPRIVRVPIGERSEAAVALSGLLATMAPDEFLIDIDRDARELHFHVVGGGDPDGIRRRHDLMYRRFVEPVVP